MEIEFEKNLQYGVVLRWYGDAGVLMERSDSLTSWSSLRFLSCNVTICLGHTDKNENPQDKFVQ